ncbi:hypothetical protein [Halobacillus litoralis]|uniref:hypothetical protein n=1 Tax=Halobacillus litoralis TaxID=45668 RepID=UPI001CD5C453|nr:hypothetical protein [Halobacillus litoralis]MCA1021570.1 hypothetical protein [Halobacillus litoralis]
MSKYYTENKEMYFEVQEIQEGSNLYQVAAFHKRVDRNGYDFERMIPEDYLLDTKNDAESLAITAPMVYDWGFDDSQYVVKDKIKDKLLDVLNKF